jgi:hypothetical protein
MRKRVPLLKSESNSMKVRLPAIVRPKNPIPIYRGMCTRTHAHMYSAYVLSVGNTCLPAQERENKIYKTYDTDT